ncbi:hypothetical protein SO802_014250 [Lithocarpus litseifolius]|uniref:Uncharacterized protein n=1 Tax=Lithocarpus litseifolius TaxID=425828 RepID=A0AAW2CRL6_9ROSI
MSFRFGVYGQLKSHKCAPGLESHPKIKDLAMSFIKFEVGDGKTIFLWHDNWHPIGAALRAKTTYSLSTILLEESGLPVELAEAPIPDC